MRATIFIALVAAAVSSVILAGYLVSSRQRVWEVAYANGAPYAEGIPGKGVFNILAARGDGQLYAAIAKDPLLAGKKTMTREETAYQAARPVVPWLAWLTSGGRPHLATTAVTIVAIGGGVLAVVGVGTLFVTRGRTPWWGFVALAPAGAWVSLAYAPSTLYAVGLTALALAFWDRRRPWAVWALGIGLFSRQEMMLVLVALAVWELVHRKRFEYRLLAPVALWAAWLGFVHERTGAWFWEATRLGALERTGFGGIREIFSTPENIPPMLLLAFLVAALLRRERTSREAWVVVSILAVTGATGGVDTWNDWIGFARVLLTCYVLAIVVIISPTSSDTAGSSTSVSALPATLPIH